jgi:polyisoprenoid-binding protein YceI
LRLRHALLGVALVFAFALPACLTAQEAVFELDAAHTQIQFTLPGAIRAVHGTFKLKSGTIRFNPTTGKADGSVVVDMTSEESDNVSLDRKIQGEVLETRKYPEATFIPTQIDGRLEAEEESALQLSGMFKLHGIEHDLMVETTVTRNGDHLTAATQFQIPYVDWGMRNPGGMLLRVGNQVELNIKTVGRITLPAAPH